MARKADDPVKLKRALARVKKERSQWKEICEEGWAKGDEGKAVLEAQIKSLAAQLVEEKAEKADVERAKGNTTRELNSEVNALDVARRHAESEWRLQCERAELAEARLARLERGEP